jgi:cell division protein FtsN
MTDTPIEVLNKYSKQIDELAENAEIEAELDAEKEIRSKNTRIVGISTIALSLMGVVYFLVQGGNNTQELDPAILEASRSVAEEAVLAPELTNAEIAQEEILQEEVIQPVQEEPVVPEPTRSVLKESDSNAGQVTKTSLTTDNSKPVIRKARRAPSRTPVLAKVASVPAVKKKSEKVWAIQVGAFLIEDNANKFAKSLQDKGFKSELKNKLTTGQQYVVLGGVFPTEEQAVGLMKSLAEKGYSPNLKKMETGDYGVSLGQFHSKSSAENLKSDLEKKGFTASIPRMPVKQTTYTVQVAGYDSVQKAKKDKVKLAGLGFKNSFIH